MTPACRLLLIVSLLALSPPLAAAEDIVEVTADPATVRLHGPSAQYSLLITGRTADGRLVDRTHLASFQALDSRIVRVSSAGVVQAVSDGATTVQVQAEGRTLQVAVTVDGSTAPRRFNFENDIVPLLSRFGCNSSGCHGKAEGQNGFKLSVFGFDPAADYAALVKEARGRRVFPPRRNPACCCARCPAACPRRRRPHPRPARSDYETIRDWIAAGTPVRRSPSDPQRQRRSASSRASACWRMHGQQQLRVIARYSDGREVDVTAHARFQSNNDGLASVQPSGLVTAGESPGEVAVMASFMNAVDIFRVDRAAGRTHRRLSAPCPRTTSSTVWSSASCTSSTSCRPNWPTTPSTCAASIST